MKLGWAFFGLAVVAAVAYSLNRGVYVGSEVRLVSERSSNGLPWYEKDCHYLFPTGVYSQWVSQEHTRKDAEVAFCRFFKE